MQEFTIPGGREKGTPLSEATDQAIDFWRGAKTNKLTLDPDHLFAEADREWVVAADEEIARRTGTGGPPNDAEPPLP
jgi:hypothetical protein